MNREFLSIGGGTVLITILLLLYCYLLIYLPQLAAPVIHDIKAHLKLKTAGLPLSGHPVLFHSVQMGDDDIRTEIGRGDHSAPPLPFYSAPTPSSLCPSTRSRSSLDFPKIASAAFSFQLLSSQSSSHLLGLITGP